MQVVTTTDINEYPLLSKGKVRDIYEISADSLLIVTTDRMSAFDVIMSKPVPYKGVVLNQITLFWMDMFSSIPNHLIEDDVKKFPAPLQKYTNMLEGRSVLVKKAQPLPLECIVRGYISGSGWKDYQKTGKICDHVLPAGLKESDTIGTPLFTPSTKAELGEHDENITTEAGIALVGEKVFTSVKNFSIDIFSKANAHAEQCGIIIADTKFEFGFVNGEVTLIDEVLTPDSSRFWAKEQYEPGHGQPSFDKQYLRDWLEAQPWDKTSPAPELPEEVIKETSKKYQDAYTKLTGKSLVLG